MATSSYFSVLLSISVTCFLLLLPKVHSSEQTRFYFNRFNQSDPNLIFQGDAHVTETGQVRLTSVENGVPLSESLGRVLYSPPIRFWNSDTQAVIDFTLEFAFNISAPDKANAAEGLAFFLAPVDTEPQKPGGYLGIFKNESYDREIQTVAVEFDTNYNQDWDPEHRHIGIDLNHISSVATAEWNFSSGELAAGLILYRCETNSLIVKVMYPYSSSRTIYTLVETVDLREYLPEWGRIGFSATSGLSEGLVESHDLLEWYFNSLLVDRRCDPSSTENMHLSSYV